MISGVPSFKGFHMTEKGRESLQKRPTSFIDGALLPTVALAQKDTKNNLSIEDDGCIYIQTPRYGKFTVNNPAKPVVTGKYFSCDVRTPDGDVHTIGVSFESEEKARAFKSNNFGWGAYIPRMNLDLYKAILAEDTYRESLINQLKEMS